MKYKAKIDIMPLPALLDPQGKAVQNTLHNIGVKSADNVRIGKHIEVELDAIDESDATHTVKEMCEKLLVNKVMEHYTFAIEKI